LDTTQALVDVKVNDEINYLPLLYFRPELIKNNWGMDSVLVNNYDEFKRKYFFEPYKNPLLNSISSLSKSRLLLTLSKPFGNYLLGEIIDTGLGATPKNKFGKMILLLFVFNGEGVLIKVLHMVGGYR